MNKYVLIMLVCGLSGVALVGTNVYATLQSTVIFDTVNYRYGWDLYKQFVDYPQCPFEFVPGPAKCNSDAVIVPSLYHLTRPHFMLTIPDDIKLVTSDGYVVDDEVCMGDRVKMQSNVEKGEWWESSGWYDSPPIYWVEDAEDLFLSIMEYHESKSIPFEDGETCLDMSYARNTFVDGYVDPVFDIPLYKVSGWSSAALDDRSMLNIICSVDEYDKGFDLKKEGEYYVVENADVLDLKTELSYKCFLYFYGDFNGPCFIVFRTPGVVEQVFEVPLTGRSYRDPIGVQQASVTTLGELLYVGNTTFKKKIKVVEPVEEPELQIKTIITDSALDYGETTYVRLLIKNKGATEIKLKNVESNVNHEFIYCDKETLGPEEQADCVLTITPDEEVDVSATVNFEYRRCGKRIEGSNTKSSSTVTVHALRRCQSNDDCESPDKVCCNRICRTALKGACDDFDGDGHFEWMYY